MKTKTLILTLLAAIAGAAHADIIPLTAFRSVDISGRASGDTYSASSSSIALGTFAQTLSDSADGSDPEGSLYHADSRATQTSLITPDQISLSSELFAFSSIVWSYPATLGRDASSTASTIFDLTFRVQSLQAYTLNWSGSAPQTPGFFPILEFDLINSSGQTIASMSSIFREVSGFLAPDDYRLRFNSIVIAVKDPLGNLKTTDFDMNMRVASVPETGSTLALMAIALGAVLVFHPRLRLA